jgi:hypothetical protein
MSFLDGGRCALPAVTHHAAELVRGVRNYRMPTKRLRTDVGKTGFFQSHMAGGAAVHNA